MPELVTDARFAERGPRAANAALLNAMIEEWTSARSTETVLDELYEKRRIPAVRVRATDEVMQDPSLRKRNIVVPIKHPTLPDVPEIPGPGLPIMMSE